MGQHLANLLQRRDHGLLTQSEFEMDVEEICGLMGFGIPTIVDLRRGGTRFVLKDPHTRKIWDQFEFRPVPHEES
jgi:hypothetical protein